MSQDQASRTTVRVPKTESWVEMDWFGFTGTRIEEVTCLTRPIGIGSLAKQVTHATRGGTMNVQKSPSGKLVVTKDGPVTRITLNRPECHNALDREVSAELNQTIKDANVDRD